MVAQLMLFYCWKKVSHLPLSTDPLIDKVQPSIALRPRVHHLWLPLRYSRIFISRILYRYLALVIVNIL